MELIDLDEGGLATLEDGSGFYCAVFSVNEEKKLVEVHEVTYSTSLQALSDSFGEHPLSRKGVTHESGYEDQISKLIERELFPPEIDDRLAVLLLRTSTSRKTLSCRLTTPDSPSDHSENKNEIFRGSPEIAGCFLSPLNAMLLMYSNSVEQPDAAIGLRICKRTVEDVQKIINLDNQLAGSEYQDSESLEIDQEFERELASLWIRSSVIANKLKILENIARIKIPKNFTFKWQRIENRPTKRFNIERFRSDHPELYAEYSKIDETQYLVKQRGGNVFPLTGAELVLNLKKGFES